MVVVIVDRVERVASLGANRRAPEAGAARFIPGTHPVALDAARVRREGGDQFGCRNDASTPTRRCPVVGAVTTVSLAVRPVLADTLVSMALATRDALREIRQLIPVSC